MDVVRVVGVVPVLVLAFVANAEVRVELLADRVLEAQTEAVVLEERAVLRETERRGGNVPTPYAQLT